MKYLSIITRGFSMMHIPLEQIKSKIKEAAGLSDDEIEERLKKKLDQLAGLISKEGAAHILANELGIDLSQASAGRLQIKNLLSGMRNVELLGKIIALYEIREFNTGARSGKVGSFMLADETGSIRIVLWN